MYNGAYRAFVTLTIKIKPMSIPIVAWFTERAKRKRLERYRLQLGLIGRYIFDAKKVPTFLSQFWRQLEITDLLGFTADQRMSHRMLVAHAHLPDLVVFITQFNQLMAEEDDGALEQLCHSRFADSRLQTLELYLADEKHYAIDVKAALMQLKSQLLIHCHTLEHFDHQFYQRQASRFYLDLHRVTVQWVQLITGEEIIPYNEHQ